jgi:hypothetical protein
MLRLARLAGLEMHQHSLLHCKVLSSPALGALNVVGQVVLAAAAAALIWLPEADSGRVCNKLEYTKG